MKHLDKNGPVSPGVAAIAALATLSASAAAQHDHEGDYVVGVNGSGVLVVEGDFDEAMYLPPFSGSVNGWLGDEPGFLSLDEDEPDEDLFVPGGGADIYFELVSADPACKVYDPFFELLSPGERFGLGGSAFDEHPFWHIDSDDPAFDPAQTEWSVAWRLVDLGTTDYAPSALYTSTFTNVPGPAWTGLAAAVGAAASRRRRR